MRFIAFTMFIDIGDEACFESLKDFLNFLSFNISMLYFSIVPCGKRKWKSRKEKFVLVYVRKCWKRVCTERNVWHLVIGSGRNLASTNRHSEETSTWNVFEEKKMKKISMFRNSNLYEAQMSSTSSHHGIGQLNVPLINETSALAAMRKGH